MEYHYTIIGIGGYHSENIIVLKSFGHVPDQKVEGLVKYSTQLANEQFGEDEDYQGEYEDYVEFGTADAMSNFYHDVGIDEAVGEYHINEQYKLVKHIPPHRSITAGDANFEGDEMFFIRTLDGWDGSVNEKTFRQFYTENLNRFENMDDLIFGVMDLIYSAGDYEANLRPVSVVDYGIKETQQMIDDYLTGAGLKDTQPEWYQQRFDIYKQLDDDVVQSSKDPDNLPEEPDGEWKTEEEYKEEMEDHHELYARFRAMVLAAMHNKSWKEYTNEYSDDHILNSTRRQNDVWKASERMRDGFGINEGLWANINAKKKRGGKSAKKGSKAYKAAKKAGDKLEVTKENFKDGKKKGKSRPGRVKKAGTSCNGSVTELRKRAKNSSGEKAKMSHWCANMKSGKKKN